MVPVSGIQVDHNNKAIADLFFAGGGFRFSDDAAAYQRFSRGLSEIVGTPRRPIPVLVVNQGDLPFSFVKPTGILAPAFGPDQITARAGKLQLLFEATFPRDRKFQGQQRFPKTHKLLQWFNLSTAADNAHAVAVTDTINHYREPHRVLSPRMEGQYWNRAGIILTPDRSWSAKSIWSFLTGLNEDEIVNHPKVEALRVMAFCHELSHVLQRARKLLDSAASDNQERCWENEKDADIGAVDIAMALANDPRATPEFSRDLRQVIEMLAPSRALSRFLISPEFYDTALAVTAHVKKEQQPDFKQVCAVGDELRWRCHNTVLHQEKLRNGTDAHEVLLSEISPSRVVQNTTSACRQQRLIDPTLSRPITEACRKNRPAESNGLYLRTLQEVLKFHPITDPLTMQAGGLILQAAAYTNPELVMIRDEEHQAASELFSRNGLGSLEVVPDLVIPPAYQIDAVRHQALNQQMLQQQQGAQQQSVGVAPAQLG